MPVSESYRPDPRFEALGPAFADPVEPAAFPQARVRVRNQTAAALTGLDTLTEAEWDAHLLRFEPLPDNQSRPLAMRYHGHQFRSYNPDIGDGRGFLFAQMRGADGRLMDLGTKGTGRTPWSRTGDGRLTLQGAVREALAASFLTMAGVDGCAILSIHETGEELARPDETGTARGAIMVRQQHSHVRIGTFQRHAAEDAPDRIRALVDHAVDAYFPDLATVSEAERPIAFFEKAIAANARLAGQWLAAGYVHGVLNSDNMTVTGASFDYGPFRVLPVYEPGFTAAYFDHTGLYAYARQPEAVAWNLARLGEALGHIAPMEAIETAYREFDAAYAKGLREAWLARLGLAPTTPSDDSALVMALYQFLRVSRAPFEAAVFDLFAGGARVEAARHGPRAHHYRGAAFDELAAHIAGHDPAPGVDPAHPRLTSGDPPAVPVIANARAAWDAIAADDDWSVFEAMLADMAGAQSAYGR